MANRDEWDSPDAAVVVHAFERLRGRDGITLARLQNSHNGGVVARLLGLSSIRNLASVQGIEPADAALQIITRCTADMGNVTHQIVVDAVLALGMLSDLYSQQGIEERVVRALRSDALGKRRSALLTHWRRLHDAMGAIPGVAPSDRTLRGTVEPEVFKELARRLVALGTIAPDPDGPLTELDVVQPELGTSSADGVSGARTRPYEEDVPDDPPSRSSGRVLVVGAAVMDAIFRTRTIPQHETSEPAHGFALSPGGKGLSQAVAAARLGLEVSLITTLADDQFGQEILQHLRKQKVDTSLVKIVPGARTPVTGVFELPMGDSIAAVWRNEREISLEVRDVDEVSNRISGCDVVLATFETPRETLHRTLSLAHAESHGRPLVIVTPGQPYPDGGLSRQSLAHIDYLVAHTWELEKLAPPTDERFDPDRVSEQLLERGVKNVCLLGNGGGRIYSHTEAHPRKLPTHWSHFKESSTTRDAFCAALAAKLIEGKSFTSAVAKWVTAAMACAAEDFSHSTTMPDRERIERKLRQVRGERRRHQSDRSG